MPLTLSNFIGFGISALVTLFISIYLIRSYLKRKEITVGCFASFIAARLGFFVFLALASLIYIATGNLLIPAVLFVITLAMIFLSLVFPPLLFCNIKWPRMKKIYPGLIGGVGVLGIILVIVKFTPIIIDPNTGLAFASFPQLSMMCYVFAKLFGVLPLSILFLSQVGKGEKWMRIRSLLIGLGLLWVVSTIIIPSLLPGAWAGLYASIGDILIFAGVMTKPKKIE